MFDLRDGFASDDLLQSVSRSNMLYDKNLILSTSFKIIDPKVHYWAGRQLLHLVPIVYVWICHSPRIRGPYEVPGGEIERDILENRKWMKVPCSSLDGAGEAKTLYEIFYAISII